MLYLTTSNIRETIQDLTTSGQRAYHQSPRPNVCLRFHHLLPLVIYIINDSLTGWLEANCIHIHQKLNTYTQLTDRHIYIYDQWEHEAQLS